MANPFLEHWDTPFEVPPFGKIKIEHYRPAFDAAIASHKEEIFEIAGDPTPANFINTIEAMERAGETLDKICAVFFNLSSSHTNEDLQTIEREIAPLLSRHSSSVMLNQDLAARVFAVPKDGLDTERARVLKLYIESFERAGARLNEKNRQRIADIQARLSELGTQFSQNVLKDEADWSMTLGENDLDGLPAFLVAQAKSEAETRDAEGYVITLSRSSVEPFLVFSDRRDLREIAWKAWIARGEETNWPLIEETITLRVERAKLLGFQDFASFKLDNQMAKNPNNVRELLMAVWEPALARAQEEAEALQTLASEEGANIQIEGWDWRHYAEKLRKKTYDLDEAETKPYLTLDAMILAAFSVAGRLFGLEFQEVEGLTLHHPDARAWEVTKNGDHVALFIGDYFARPSKRSGAWMSAYRGQEKLKQPERPIILNTCNFAKGSPTLLTFDDARTLFHEFGHALHGMLSDVTYPRISGTNVARDFVELPSQLYEHWLSVPEVLAEFARHYETGEAMPMALIEKIKAADTFNQGFATVEYTGSALVDLEMHTLSDGDAFDGRAFEQATLEKIKMPRAIPMRHRTPHFQHVFSGDGYSAGYYSYMWSEVMDADAFKAFEEAGDPFDPATAERLAKHVYSAGGREEPDKAYIGFRGNLPEIDALLEGRGLA
ncbi:MAG: M3 family metallopeptidase [Pseudomonadota bacterium]